MRTLSTRFTTLAAILLAISYRAPAAVFNIADGDVAALKSAITAANTNGDDDVIQLVAGSTYSLTTVETDVGGATGLPIITGSDGHSVTIQGDRTTIERASNAPSFRIFQIASGATVTLKGLIIAFGAARLPDTSQPTEGGGVLNGGMLTINNCFFQSNFASGYVNPNVPHNSPNAGAPGHGGALSNSGAAILIDSTFNGNSATGADTTNPPPEGAGGALYNTGDVTIIRSSFSNNGATGGGDSATTGGTARGGGISNDGTLTLSNSTVANNTVMATSGADAFGGGIMSQNGSLHLINCTISNNAVNSTPGSGSDGGPAAGGGIYLGNNGTAALRATIVGNNSATSIGTPQATIPRDVSGAFTSEGHNFIASTTGSTAGWVASDLTGTDTTYRDPRLRPLNYNLGPTETVALQPTSECINNGDDAVLADPFDLSTDQRGQPRKIGTHVDIGAFEFDPAYQNAFLAVNKFDDHDDGSCTPTDCSLREAVNQANATAGLDIIVFDLRTQFSAKITLQSNATEIGISDSVIILGPGARALTVSGGTAHGVFNVTAGTSTISGLTISDGEKSSGTSGDTNQGGAIVNQATLTLNDCEVINNAVTGAANSANAGNGGNAQGGGIYNAKQLTLNRCTFSSNTATGASGTAYSPPPMVQGPGGNGGTGQGGAVFNAATALLIVNNSTFTSNLATGGAGGAGNGTSATSKASGGDGAGAAIYDAGGSTITSSTISGNIGSGGKGYGNQFVHGTNGGGMGGITATASGQEHRVGNTIIAANTGNAGPDANGAFTSSGYNLIGIGDQSTGFTATADQVGTAASPVPPGLDTLKNNGGGTDTMSLLAGSRALDAGTAFGLMTDQRGLARTQDDVGIANAAGGDGTDIGAFELAVSTPTPTPGSTPTATPSTTPGTTPTPTATPASTPPSQLLNLSTRKQVGTGDNVLIGGFIVVGTDDKQVLLRGLGPSLPVAGALGDPVLELHRADTTLLAANDNWKDAANESEVATILPPSNDLESAILTTLTAKPLSEGGAGYTGVLSGSGGTTGIGLLEIYDLNTAANSSLANISTRGLVGTADDLLIGGFIPGPADRLPIKVLVRALGPSLSAQGVSGALQDPLLELHDANGTVIVNDNWRDASNADEIQATLPPPDDQESAIITTLAPSNSGYTAVVRGANGTTGVALVEVYGLN